jgi:hypothetical protein
MRSMRWKRFVSVLAFLSEVSPSIAHSILAFTFILNARLLFVSGRFD